MSDCCCEKCADWVIVDRDSVATCSNTLCPCHLSHSTEEKVSQEVERGYCKRCNKWLVLHPTEAINTYREGLVKTIEGMYQGKYMRGGKLHENPYDEALDSVINLLKKTP